MGINTQGERMTTRKTLEQMAQEATRERMAEDDDIQVYQRPWVGLTDEERVTISYTANSDEFDAMRLAEAKLKEKNT
jgi:hypothetical protein